MSEFLFQLYAFHFADEDLGILRHVEASQLGNGIGLLTDDLGVQRTVDNDGLTDLFGLLRVEGSSSRGRRTPS